MGGGIDRWDETTGGFEHFPLSKLANGSAEYDFVYALHETVRLSGPLAYGSMLEHRSACLGSR
jgi:hypothetical protein